MTSLASAVVCMITDGLVLQFSNAGEEDHREIATTCTIIPGRPRGPGPFELVYD